MISISRINGTTREHDKIMDFVCFALPVLGGRFLFSS